MDARRDLVFDRLDDVMPEVDRLLLGHATSKLWTLGQVLYQLDQAVRQSLQGGQLEPSRPPGHDQARAFDVRRRLFFRTGRFPEDAEIPLEVMRPPLDADEVVGAKSLRDALRMLEAWTGPFPPHPVLGPMSRDEWHAFHRIHCAHHLGFARPTSPDPAAGGVALAGDP